MTKGETKKLDRSEEAKNILLKAFSELHESEKETDPKIKIKKLKEIHSQAKIGTKILNEVTKELNELKRKYKESE